MPIEGPQLSQEQFYAFLEQEMRKLEQFTKKQVQEIRLVLSDAELKMNLSLSGLASKSEAEMEALRLQVEKAGEEFLKYASVSLCLYCCLCFFFVGLRSL